MKATVTVEVDDRGRFTVPEPARRAITITGARSRLRLEIRVLKPDDVAGNTATTTSSVDNRGRATIKPASVRDELGIRGREAIVELTIGKSGAGS